MARITEEASATLSMNMEPARKALNEATADAKRFKEQLEAILAVPEKDRSLSEKAKIPQLQSDLKAAEKRVASATEKLKKFQDTLKNLDTASFNDLYKASKELEAQIKRLKPGTEEYIAATHDLQAVKTRLADIRKAMSAVNEETTKSTSIMTRGANFFNKYWSMFDTTVRTITGVSMKFRQCAEDAAKLDDVYADVMKTTGLLHDEVADLDKELMKIDTRTSREQLLLLARDAGKLGIQGKENILGFVRAADQIQVALGEDLGEGAIKNLGKIADVFGLTKEMGIEQSLLSIASAVNALGQASTASEAYLVEFTQRLAGVGAMAGLSVQDILGFASGLDQSAMKVEMAATAFQKFLMKMYEDTATFAGYAGMKVEEFSELLKNDANTAIVTVMQAMNGQDGFASLVPMFDQMGLDGARAVTVLSSMTQNIEAVTEAQALANVEFAKGTSVSEEYATKNNNLQAELEKARKEFHNASIALGQSLNPILLKSTKGVTYLIKALANYGKEIKTVLIVVTALTVALKAKVIWQKAVALWNGTLRARSLLLAAAQALLTGNITRATAAWTMMNTAMKASVLGIVTAAVSGLVIWIQRLIDKKREAAEAAQWENKVEEKATDAYAEEAAKVSTLTRIIDNNNLSIESRRKALEELKKIVPDYHADLTDEGILINNNRIALDNYTEALKRNARLKARREDVEEREVEIQRLEDQLEAAKEREAKARKAYKDTGSNRFDVEGDLITESNEYTELQNAVAAREKLESEIANLSKVQDEAVAKLDALAGTVGKTAANGAETAGEAAENAIKEVQSTLSQAQFQMLEDRYSLLTKKEKEMVDKGYEAIGKEEAEVLKRRYDRIVAADTNQANKAYQTRLKAIQAQQRTEQNEVNRQYFNGEIASEEHEKRLREIKMQSLQRQLELAKQFGHDTSAVEESIIKQLMTDRKADYDAELRQLEQCKKDEENALAMSLAAREITEEQYQSQMILLKVDYYYQRIRLAREGGQDETAEIQAWLDAQMDAQKHANEKMKKLEEDAKKIRQGLLSPSAARDSEMQKQLDNLDKLHEAKLLSEQEYEEALKRLRKKYEDEDLKDKLGNIGKYLEAANKVSQQASDFVSALKEAETAKMEAEYQAQLAAAGDNAEERERIETEYEQKKLDLQKKYADADMAISIAKTVANGAAAAVRAIADSGWIAGGIIAGLIAATTAAEVVTIVQQRNAIKNTTLEGGGSSTSVKTGTRTVTGYSKGGYTEKSLSDNTPAGVIHANEWVAPAWLVRQFPAVFANLEQYRKTRSKSSAPSTGFQGGGYTAKPQAQPATQALNAEELKAAVREGARQGTEEALAKGRLKAYVVRRDIKDIDEQDERFKKQTSRS